MRSPTPSKYRAGRAARFMRARLSLPGRIIQGIAMAKADDVPPLKPTERIAAPERVAAFRTGLSAEARAAAYLIAKGYRILAMRFRSPYGEIDIVARRRNLLAFVEVKARATLDDAAWAVTPRQQQRIINAAQA